MSQPRRPRSPARQTGEELVEPTSPGDSDDGPDSTEIVFEFQGYRGPVPPPALVDGYQRALPSGGERVLAMAEQESEHRRDMDRRQLRASLGTHVLGQVLGFLLAAGIVAGGIYLIATDRSLWGLGIVLLGAAGLIRAVFRPDSGPSENR
jgi:uncharacterized membrane protein